MTNVTFMDIKNYDGSILEFVQIANEDGSTTSMPKAEYETKLVDEAKTK